ncbi:MAG: ABC transporter substrate-binding protein [Candidatus Nanopelagicales bacterium]|jgi:branched-chain amino acid transport system substrate-binding protein|nr:ABC transporter substrate-binding protein [Candidatus Nanopelagicales bacterium]
MRTPKIAVGLASLALVLAACSSESDADSDASAETATASAEETTTEEAASVDVIKIGSIHPLTGGLAADGLQMDAGAQLAAADINAAGGISCLDGAQIEILSADSTGTPEVGQSEAERLIQEGVIALVGPYQSAVASNIATVAERNGIPFVIDVAVADEILTQGYTNTFRIQPNASAMGSQGAKFLKELTDAEGIEVSKIAMLHEQSAFGTSVYEAFKTAAEANGWTVDPVISYDAFGVTDLTTDMTKVKDAAPDVIVVTGYYGDGVLATEAISAVDPGAKLIYGIAQGAFDNPSFPADVAGAGEGFFNVNYHLDVTNPVTVDLANRFAESYGEEMKTSATHSYEAVRVIANALETSCSEDPAALRDAIADTNLDSILATVGPIQFDETGENINGSPIVMQVQDDAIVQVLPENVAENAPRFN